MVLNKSTIDVIQILLTLKQIKAKKHLIFALSPWTNQFFMLNAQERKTKLEKEDWRWQLIKKEKEHSPSELKSVCCACDPEVPRTAYGRQQRELGILSSWTGKTEHLAVWQKALGSKSQETHHGTESTQTWLKLGNGEGCCHFNVLISK